MMERTLFKRSLVLLFAFILVFSVCEGQSFDRPPAHKLQKNVRKRPIRSRTIKIREPRSIEKAKKKTEANERKLKKEYAKYVRDNKKRSLEIQTPAVRERMKQNFKNADARYKSKRKNMIARNRDSAKKYRR